jgi:subtilase family serine protease
MGGEETQGLGIGATHTEHEDFTLEYPGWYNMMACADSNHQVPESNENNQCKREVAFEVVSSPNLTLTAIATTTGKTVFDPGETFSVNVTAQNLGENFGKSIYVGWYLTGGSYGTGAVFLTTDRILRENLKGGMAKVENLAQAFAPSIPGMYTLIARIDYDNRVPETNESDNEIRLSILVRGSSEEDDDDLFQLLLN